MATIKPHEIAAEDADASRENSIAEALVGNAPHIPGVTVVRGITPLVMLALQRVNNPYVTAAKGFAAMGIKFEGGETDSDPAAFGISMMPKTAEVLILFSCDKADLRRYATAPAALEEAALDFMEDTTPDVLAEATVFISGMLTTLSKSRAEKAPEDTEAPEASTLKEGARGVKKPVPTGLRKS